MDGQCLMENFEVSVIISYWNMQPFINAATTVHIQANICMFICMKCSINEKICQFRMVIVMAKFVNKCKNML